MKHIKFTPGNWEDKINYAYSARFDVMPKFTQEVDCIKNEPNDGAYFGHDNISLLTREKYSANITLELTCSLVGSACPVILLVKDAEEKNGALIYKEYIEVVLWNGGVTLWYFWNTDEGVKWHRVARTLFPVAENEKHKLKVYIEDKYLKITTGENYLLVRISELYDEFHVGVNACEGVCKLYDFTISPETKEGLLDV